MQLSWIYDLNYSASFRQIIERDIIDNLEQALPKEQQIGIIVHAARSYIEKTLTLESL